MLRGRSTSLRSAKGPKLHLVEDDVVDSRACAEEAKDVRVPPCDGEVERALPVEIVEIEVDTYSCLCGGNV